MLARFRIVKVAAALAFVLLLLRTATDLAHPLLVATALDALIGAEGLGGSLPQRFVWALWGLLALLVLKMLFTYAAGVASTAVGQQVENDLRRDLFQHLLALRFEYHDENRSGATLVRALRDLQKARHFFKEVAFGWLEVLLLVAGAIVATLWIDWVFGLAVAVVFGGGIAVTGLASRRVASLDRAVSESYDSVTTALQENVAGARVVRAFGREGEEIERFGARMDSLTDRWIAHERYWTRVMPYVSHSYHMALPLVLGLGAWRISSAAASLGDVAAVLFYVRLVQNRIRPLVRLMVMGQQALASSTRVFEVLDDGRTLPTTGAAQALPPGGGQLQLHDVAFAYPGGPEVLKGICLNVPAGTSLGIIGPTGAGKSTLAHLLPRLYEPTRGRVLLDGVDVRELRPHELRRAVALVFQESVLFSGTVAENVAYGQPDLTTPGVHEQLRRAAASEFVDALPAGIQTIVGERGVSLSGGQRLRVAIARSLACRPRVLVLDDATASGDSLTERQLFEGFREAAAACTLVIISQRIPSVRHCDQIAVLDQGRITALGTHEHLLVDSPLYREIHEQQKLTGVLP